jgi:hypothetical protein
MDRMQKDAGIPHSEQIRRALGVWLTQQESFRANLRKSLELRKAGK